MPVTLVTDQPSSPRTVRAVTRSGLAGLDEKTRQWAQDNDFRADPGSVLLLPGKGGVASGALLGVAESESDYAPLVAGALARRLPDGEWAFSHAPANPELASLGLMLGGYSFTRYRQGDRRDIRFHVPDGVDAARVRQLADGVFLARDLVNTPTSDMGPQALEQAVRTLARSHKATVKVIAGDDLLKKNFPMIHAVGRASAETPRLIDMVWGRKSAPKVTLVGKGVCFDTGGLDIKPASGMLLMKKDMGGAANVLGLALMVMSAKLDIRLRVLIPAVENSISGNAFRPGDVLTSRKGLTVEVGNTDAEGRLVLADALALADEDEPQMLIDMATLTGAARVALGPDLPPFFTDDEVLAGDLSTAAAAVADPLWRMPLWKPYDQKFPSKIADINNVNTDGFAGAIVAAMFLRRFVEKAKSWAHFDILAWSPTERHHCPVGGEAQGIRAIEEVLRKRYG